MNFCSYIEMSKLSYSVMFWLPREVLSLGIFRNDRSKNDVIEKITRI